MHRKNHAYDYRAKPKTYHKNNTLRQSQQAVGITPLTFHFVASERCSNLALVLMFMTLSAQVISVNAQMTSNKNSSPNRTTTQTANPSIPKPSVRSSNSTVLMNHQIAKICRTMPFQNSNKAPGIVYGSLNGNLMPEVCAGPRPLSAQSVSNCHQQITEAQESLPKIYEKHANTVSIHKTVSRDATETQDKFFAELNSVGEKLTTTPEQRSRIQGHAYFINRLLFRQKLKTVVTRLGTGFCDSQAATNQYDIIIASNKAGEKVKVQSIGVSRDQPGNDVPLTLFNGHAFTLVNSNVDDVVIESNKTAAENYLQKISSGFICDSWNEGFFKRAANNQNELYRSNWDSVSVVTVSAPDDEGYADLPKEIADILQKYAAEAGLKIPQKSSAPRAKQ